MSNPLKLYDKFLSLPVVKYPEKILHEKCRDVTPDELASGVIVEKGETWNLAELRSRMLKTMYASSGIGLAAPQIGLAVRLFVFHIDGMDAANGGDVMMINPELKNVTEKRDLFQEGCLSLPGVYGKVRRWKDLVVKAYNEKGVKFDFLAYDMTARVCQHEYDHLDGVLFVERAREIDLPQIKKQLKVLEDRAEKALLEKSKELTR